MQVQVVQDHLHLDLEDDEDIIDEAEDTLTILNNYVDNLEIKNLMDKIINQGQNLDINLKTYFNKKERHVTHKSLCLCAKMQSAHIKYTVNLYKTNVACNIPFQRF